MSKDIKKALEHCIEWNCADCPNREELGSGETVCRGRLLPEVLEYVADLEAKLAESEADKKVLICDYESRITKHQELMSWLEHNNDELKKQLEEKEKDNQFLKKMYLSEKQKNDNYHTEKYGLDKPVEELRKIKLTPKEKEIYYNGFNNCERQFATHIVELQQQLKSQPAEIVEKIKEQLIKRLNTIAGYGRMTTDELSFFIETEFGSDLDTILKEYGGNNENRN